MIPTGTAWEHIDVYRNSADINKWISKASYLLTIFISISVATLTIIKLNLNTITDSQLRITVTCLSLVLLFMASIVAYLNPAGELLIFHIFEGKWQKL